MVASSRLRPLFALALLTLVASACPGSPAPSAPVTADARGSAPTEAAPPPAWRELEPDELRAALRELHPPSRTEWRGLAPTTEERRREFGREAQLLRRLREPQLDAEVELAVLFELAELYARDQVEEYERSTESALRGLELAPESGELWSVLGLARSRAGDSQPALACLARAAELSPSAAAPLREAARIHVAEGELEAAEALYREALALDPDDRDARYGIAALLEERGELEPARAHLERLLESGGEHPSPLFRLARVLEALGRTDEAAEMRRRHERATILDDMRLREANVSPLRKRLAVGAWYLDHDRAVDALPEYLAARDLARGDEQVAVLAGLVDCCARLDRLEAGRAYLAELRELQPDLAVLPQLAALLER